jgi:uncharacterized protein (TIGR02271 family)
MNLQWLLYLKYVSKKSPSHFGKEGREVAIKNNKATEISAGEKKIIPLIEEQLKVGKRSKVVGITRIKKAIQERVELVEQPLKEDEIQVERVPINKIIEKPVSVRKEHGITIVPVLEEVLIVEKRLVLREELHIKKLVKTVNKRQEVTLRTEQAFVEHISDRDLIKKTG